MKSTFLSCQVRQRNKECKVVLFCHTRFRLVVSVLLSLDRKPMLQLFRPCWKGTEIIVERWKTISSNNKSKCRKISCVRVLLLCEISLRVIQPHVDHSCVFSLHQDGKQYFAVTGCRGVKKLFTSKLARHEGYLRQNLLFTFSCQEFYQSIDISKHLIQ